MGGRDCTRLDGIAIQRAPLRNEPGLRSETPFRVWKAVAARGRWQRASGRAWKAGNSASGTKRVRLIGVAERPGQGSTEYKGRVRGLLGSADRQF